MEVILADAEKITTSVKITVMSVEEKNMVINSSLWLRERHHREDGYTEIRPNILCRVCYHWRNITLQCPNMDRP